MKEQRIKSDRFWDWSAARYDRQVRRNELYEKAVERFTKYLEPEHAVLDYACGPGVITFKIAGVVREVHGIDTSAGMIEVAKRRIREMRRSAKKRYQRIQPARATSPAPLWQCRKGWHHFVGHHFVGGLGWLELDSIPVLSRS